MASRRFYAARREDTAFLGTFSGGSPGAWKAPGGGSGGNRTNLLRAMRLRPFACTALAFALLAGAARAQSTPAPTASPQPAASGCLARLSAVVPVDADASGRAETYALMLSSLGLDAGRASGTVALFAGNERYEVPFSRVVATGARDLSLDGATPIFVRFPRRLAVDGGYVASLADPEPGKCIPAYPWTPKNAAAKLSQPNVTKLRGRLLTATVVTAPPPVGETIPVCAHPYAAASVKTAAAPALPEAAQDMEGSVETLVSLDGAGAVVDVEVWHSSGHDQLDRAAARAALVSKYAPEIFRCAGVPSSYVFAASFKGE
jgi:TonB family protein